MKCKCDYCGVEHEDLNWKTKFEKMEDESERMVTLCSKYFKPQAHEFTTDEIKQGREKYLKSTFQPTRGGIVSKEYIEANPERAKQQFTPQQIDSAQDVWKDLKNYSHWRKTL